jgi:signal transduction histidine kinase/CheY-like chemotaxis protein
MLKFENWPIERKLLGMNLLTAGSALLLACAAFISYDFVSYRQTLTERLTAYADIVGANSASAILFHDVPTAERNLKALEARSGIDAAALYTAEGSLFAQWVRPTGGFGFPSTAPISRDQLHMKVNALDLFHPVMVDRSAIGIVYIHADLSERVRRLEKYLLIATLVLIFSIIVSILLSRPLGRQISHPLLELVQVARQVSQERNYSIRVGNYGGGGEVRLLIDTFNQMLYQIQQRGEAVQRAQSDLERKVEERTAELHKKEEELYLSRRLESIGRLAGGVAHDFNNLMVGILGCSETLEAEIPASSPLAIEVQEIKRAGERAATLTRQLLGFGRRQIIRPASLSLNTAVQSTTQLLRRLIGEDIRITFDLEKHLDPIFADPGQMEQILVNLAVNARDAMPRGGQLIISTRNYLIGPEGIDLDLNPGAYVMLSVSDNGVGMTKEVQSQIFEPFFTTKALGKGTGLGLSTVYGIVKQNQGGIQVYSKPGYGSTFKIFLPREGPAPEASEPTQEIADKMNAPESRGESILVVEDEPLVASRVVRTLIRKGYTVLSAASAEEALDLMEKRGSPVDLVLTDVVMPGMNGHEMVLKFRERWPGLRALFMSGYPAEIIAQHGVVDPQIAFIEKPFYTEQICTKIREVLDA